MIYYLDVFAQQQRCCPTDHYACTVPGKAATTCVGAELSDPRTRSNIPSGGRRALPLRLDKVVYKQCTGERRLGYFFFFIIIYVCFAVKKKIKKPCKIHRGPRAGDACVAFIITRVTFCSVNPPLLQAAPDEWRFIRCVAYIILYEIPPNEIRV